MNIIFLDMDGVINNRSFVQTWVTKFGRTNDSIKKFRKNYCINESGLYFIVPELRDRFNLIISSVENCKVVWSSSWRLFYGHREKPSKYYIENLYYKCGFPKNSLLSWTPNLPYLLRSNEITKWIDDNYKIYDIEKIAIIDDLEEANPFINNYENIPIKFFLTSEKYGLTEEISNNILNYFIKDKN